MSNSEQAHEVTFPIVGVGASAGGLEAFSEMLRALPADPGMAFVFVQHLDPKHVSMLAELLGRQARMAVVEARNHQTVERDRVYVIPSNTSLTVEQGKLILGPREVVGGHFISVDTFFQSLARDRGPASIGVLLSGTASDGSLGLTAIKAAGGVTFAQDPGSAKFDGMPRAAIRSGCVDFVCTPEEVAKQLLVLRDRIAPPHRMDTGQEEGIDGSDGAIARILAIVRGSTGVDFSNYKPNTVKRRILRRMLLRREDDIHNYLAALRSDAAEAKALYEDILINVTEFFRDPEAFAALASMLPRQIDVDKGAGDQIRVWVPGCSTGEEAYSLAMTILEFLDDRASETRVQIFATDVSESALEKARAGVYDAIITRNVSPERLRRFFNRHDSGYQIQKRVRELCVFARHNLAKDPPFSRLDLISCRNVLIYLGSVLQQRVIPTFHYALNPDGLLLLGSSETVGAHPDLFQMVDKKNKIYQRQPSAARFPVEIFASQPLLGKPEAPAKSGIGSESDLQREADRIVINKYGPPGAVVDEEMNIVQFRGQVSRFLDPVSGAASLNLLRMLKDSLAVEVKNAISKARQENASVRREGVRLDDSGRGGVHIEVIPFTSLAGRDRKYLIVFEAAAEQPTVSAPAPGERTSPMEERLREDGEHLRRELSSTREYLQSIIEDQEAAHEELRSASEEIQSSNEELQSTNEELETAKEELQSTNEELGTVNEELQTRNMQLSQVGNDLMNVLANVNMPIVILGNDLRIRRFTPVAEKALNLIPSDVGRPIRDIHLRVPVAGLEAVLLDVADNLTSHMIDVADSDGHTYSLRIRPYRTEDNKISGVVMVFIDLYPASRAAEGGVTEEPVRAFPRALRNEINQRLELVELQARSLEASADKEPEHMREGLAELRRSLARMAEYMGRMASRPDGGSAADEQ